MMLVHTRTNVTMEVVKWAILVILATALVLGVLTHVVGQETAAEPRTLDAHPRQLKPVPMPRVERPIWPPTRQHAADFFNLWNVIGLHANDQHREAIEAWNAIEMPPATKTWKHVGQGAASLELNRLDQAARDFKKALATDRSNAVAEYYLGVTRLAQAAVSPEMAANHADRFHMLNEVPAPRDRAAMLLAAERHLQRAITLADKCDVNAPLLPVGQPEQWIRLVSTKLVLDVDEQAPVGLIVSDLLEALRIVDYVKDARVQLQQIDANRQPMQLLNHVTQVN